MQYFLSNMCSVVQDSVAEKHPWLYLKYMIQVQKSQIKNITAINKKKEYLLKRNERPNTNEIYVQKRGSSRLDD